MFVKQVDGQDYSFRIHWDAATSGPYYWIVVDVTPHSEYAGTPLGEKAITKIHSLLEKRAGFPNVPGPTYEDGGKTARFKIRTSRVPRGGKRARKASDWIKLLEKAIQTEL